MDLSNPWLKRLGYLAVFIVSAFVGDALYDWYQSTTPGAEAARAAVGAPAPRFALPDLDGQVRRSDEWAGKVMVVNFWATWCPPCRREMPAFVELQHRYANEGVVFVGIALDEAGKAAAFADEVGVDYPILVGDESAIETAKAFGNRFGALPYTAVVDRRGNIRYTHRGEVTEEELEAEIRSLL